MRIRVLLAVAALAVAPCAVRPAAAQAADSIRSWDLPTGSRVAWVRVPAARAAGLPPLIYVHGGPGAYEVASLGAYRRFAARWAALGYDVVFYDQIGSGLSARLTDPTGYTVARHVADLDAIRERLGAARVVLIGESWGATLAAHYIAAHPDRVARAVFVSPGALDASDWEGPPGVLRLDPELLAWVRDHGPAAAYRWCLELSHRMTRDVRAAHAWAGDAAPDSLLDAWLTSQILVKAVADPSKVASARMHGMGFWAWTMTNRDERTGAARARPRLGRFEQPVLILHGSADYLPAAFSAQYAAVFPRARLVQVPGAGHLIWVDRPDAYADAIDDLLAAPPAERR